MSDFDVNQVEVKEVRSVLKKFDGDLTADQMEATTPAEEIHLIDDEIVKHVVDGTVVFDAEAGIGEKPDFSAPTTEEE